MSTESVLLQARLAVKAATENEPIYFALAAMAIVLLGMWFLYIMRRWSWIPRKRQRRYFVERF
jgi:O-antigen/teichoic acid export membrane protein